jgi:phosphatidylglycerol---prolipoprotein diacylglyceryl transferase
VFPFLRIGPFLIQMSGLVLLAGLWIAMTLIEKEANHLRLNASAILNMIFYGLIGARLVYAVQHLDVYLANPLSLFSLNTNMLNPFGGFVTGVIIAYLFGRQKLLLRPTLDALAPGFAVMMIALGVANFFSGNGYGSPTHLPWAIYLWGENRHPTQIYETLAALVIFVSWKLDLIRSRGTGIPFLQVVGLSAGARVFLEAFHGDSLVWPGGFRAIQAMGLLILAISIYFTKQWEQAQADQSRSKKSAF